MADGILNSVTLCWMWFRTAFCGPGTYINKVYEDTKIKEKGIYNKVIQVFGFVSKMTWYCYTDDPPHIKLGKSVLFPFCFPLTIFGLMFAITGVSLLFVMAILSPVWVPLLIIFMIGSPIVFLVYFITGVMNNYMIWWAFWVFGGGTLLDVLLIGLICLVCGGFGCIQCLVIFYAPTYVIAGGLSYVFSAVAEEFELLSNKDDTGKYFKVIISTVTFVVLALAITCFVPCLAFILVTVVLFGVITVPLYFLIGFLLILGVVAVVAVILVLRMQRLEKQRIRIARACEEMKERIGALRPKVNEVEESDDFCIWAKTNELSEGIQSFKEMQERYHHDVEPLYEEYHDRKRAILTELETDIRNIVNTKFYYRLKEEDNASTLLSKHEFVMKSFFEEKERKEACGNDIGGLCMDEHDINTSIMEVEMAIQGQENLSPKNHPKVVKLSSDQEKMKTHIQQFIAKYTEERQLGRDSALLMGIQEILDARVQFTFGKIYGSAGGGGMNMFPPSGGGMGMGIGMGMQGMGMNNNPMMMGGGGGGGMSPINMVPQPSMNPMMGGGGGMSPQHLLNNQKQDFGDPDTPSSPIYDDASAPDYGERRSVMMGDQLRQQLGFENNNNMGGGDDNNNFGA